MKKKLGHRKGSGIGGNPECDGVGVLVIGVWCWFVQAAFVSVFYIPKPYVTSKQLSIVQTKLGLFLMVWYYTRFTRLACILNVFKG